jgi:hypothetical protein
LRPFRGLVKQIRIDENETLMGHVLDLAFPLFRGPKTLTPQQQRVRASFYHGSDSQLGDWRPAAEILWRRPRRSVAPQSVLCSLSACLSR